MESEDITDPERDLLDHISFTQRLVEGSLPWTINEDAFRSKHASVVAIRLPCSPNPEAPRKLIWPVGIEASPAESHPV